MATETDVLRKSSVRMQSRTGGTKPRSSGSRRSMYTTHLITTGQASRRNFAMLAKLVTAGAVGEPITLRPTAMRRDATSVLHLSEVALCITHVFALLRAAQDVVVVVVTPELDVVPPVDEGAAAIEGYGWRLAKVLWTQALPIY